MSHPAICLRCDWEGRARGDACPSCGAPLFRLSVAGEREARPRAPTTPAERTPHTEEPLASEPAARGPARPFTVLGLLAATTLGLALLWSVAFGKGVEPVGRPEAGAPATPRFDRGQIVYVVAEGNRDRLYTFDLVSRVVTRGPLLAGRVEELLRARFGGGVVVTLRRPGGILEALRLRSLSVRDGTAAVLGRGEIVAWGPGGQFLVTAHRGPPGEGCHRSVSITHLDLVLMSRERVFARRSFCGDLLGISRDPSTTYLSRLTGARVGVYFVSVGRLRRLISGYALLAVSPAGDMLLTPSGGSSSPEAGRPPEAGGTVLYWRGRGGPIPIGDGERRLIVSRVVAWSPDGSGAIVEGTLEGPSSLFAIATAPESVRQPPQLIVPVSGMAGAAYSDPGVTYLVVDESLYAYVEGVLTPVDLPGDAPVPSGPVAWLP